jgi:hypothetical protein
VDELLLLQALFDDVQGRFLSMPRRGTRQQRANRSNRLTVPANDSTDIGLPHLQTKDGQAAARNFREHDFIREFDELPNDELEKLSHASILPTRWSVVQSARSVVAGVGAPVQARTGMRFGC